jgi:hypothetical protein
MKWWGKGDDGSRLVDKTGRFFAPSGHRGCRYDTHIVYFCESRPGIVAAMLLRVAVINMPVTGLMGLPVGRKVGPRAHFQRFLPFSPLKLCSTFSRKFQE